MLRRAHQFTNSVCTKPAGTMKYEWYPAAGPVKALEHGGFTTAMKSTTAIKIETIGKRLVTCTGESGSGVYAPNETVGSTQLTFTGYHVGSSEACSSGATSGEVVTVPLDGTLGVILTSSEGLTKNKVGLDLRPAATGPLAEFVCGNTTYALTGAVIAQITANAMQLNTGVWKLTQAKGIQKPTRFEGRPEQVLQLRVGGNRPEQAALSASIVVLNEERVETSSVL